MSGHVASQLEGWVRSGRSVVHELDVKNLLRSASIAVPARDPASGKTAVKLASDRFPHKTEHGLVKLNVPADEAQAVGESLKVKDPQGSILVEEMITDSVAEWIVGCKHDPTFGPVVVAGPGGVLVELFDQVEVRLAPTDRETVREMLERGLGAKLLEGVRGGPPGDRTALIDAVVNLSKLFADNADLISEIEINPLFVRPEGKGVVAADGLIILRS